MTDFLFELLSEEVPARMQADARKNLARLFAEEIGKAGLRADTVEIFATPRRLALIARGLLEATAAVSSETKGPRASAPPQAIEGFLRKTGLAREDLVERDGVLFAVVEQPGRATIDVLAEAIPAIVRAFPWPKSMRWGAASSDMGSPRWVRPLRGIVALFGEEVVPCEVAGVASGATTPGHRFHHPGPVTIGSAEDYAIKLRACHVIVDQAERETIVRDGAARAAEAAGLALVPDEGLVAENAGLTEWPVPLLGRFDPAFLEVPREVIQLTMRTNQKYFSCVNPTRHGEVAARSADGGGSPPDAALVDSPLHHPADGPHPRAGEDFKLAPAFVCTANIAARDGGAAIAAGNAKVLAARLADARFFWEQDWKVPLAEQAKKLDQIVFHEKLGTVADKVERVAKLARWLVESEVIKPLPFRGGVGGGGSPHVSTPDQADSPHPNPSPEGKGLSKEELAALAEQAARLAKADLVTGMVGEFPELQGVMGGYYARAEGLPDEVADAIRDHYKPVGQGDAVPTAPVTVAVSLADKLDSVIGFFAGGQLPTGSKDPFGLRRSALGIIRLITACGIRLSFSAALETFYRAHAARPPHGGKGASAFYLADVDDAPTVEDFGSIGFWMEHIDGIEKGKEVDRYVARLLEFDDEGRWKSFELGFSNEEVSYGEIGADEKAHFTLYDLNWTLGKLQEFFADRLKVQQREAGVRHDLIDAVFALGREDDLVRLLARVKALQAFIGTEDGANLLAGYRRAANILAREGYQPSPRVRGEGQTGEAGRGEGQTGEAGRGEGESGEAGGRPLSLAPAAPVPPPASGGRAEEQGLTNTNQSGYSPLPEEESLRLAVAAAEPRAAAAIEAEEFGEAMRVLAGLRGPVDAFFERVTVNDPEPEKRAARLALLARVRDAIDRVADFSKIAG